MPNRVASSLAELVITVIVTVIKGAVLTFLPVTQGVVFIVAYQIDKLPVEIFWFDYLMIAILPGYCWFQVLFHDTLYGMLG